MKTVIMVCVPHRHNLILFRAKIVQVLCEILNLQQLYFTEMLVLFFIRTQPLHIKLTTPFWTIMLFFV